MLRRLLSRLSAFFLVATVIGCGGPAEPMDDAGGPPDDARPGPVDTGPNGPACRFSIQCGPNEICVDDHCILAEAIPIEELEYLPEIRRATAEEIEGLPIAPLSGATRDGYPTFNGESMAMGFAGGDRTFIIDDSGVSTYPYAGDGTWVGRAPDGGYAYIGFEGFVWVHGDGSRTEWTLPRINYEYGVILERTGSVLCITGFPGVERVIHRLNADGSVDDLGSAGNGWAQLMIGPDGPEVVGTIDGDGIFFTARPLSDTGAGVTLPEPFLPLASAVQDQPSSWVMPGRLPDTEADLIWIRDQGVRPVGERHNCRPAFSRVARFLCSAEAGEQVGSDLSGTFRQLAPALESLGQLCVSRGGRRTIECFNGWTEVALSRRSR
jgi:hypothetical protein